MRKVCAFKAKNLLLLAACLICHLTLTTFWAHGQTATSGKGNEAAGKAVPGARITSIEANIVALDASENFLAYSGVSKNPDMPAPIRVWDMDQKKAITRAVGHDGPVTLLALEMNGRRLVSAGKDRTVRVWSIDTGKELFALPAHEDEVSSIAISDDGDVLVTASALKEARVWSLKTRKELLRLEGHATGHLKVAVVKGRVLTGSGDKESKDHALRLFKLSDGKEIRRLEGHTGPITGVALSQNGRWALSGSLDGTARVWDVESGKELQRWTGHKSAVQVRFASNSVMALTLDDNRARIWETENGRLIDTLPTANAKLGTRVVTGAFMQNQKVVTAGDQFVQIWNLMPSINVAEGFFPKITSGIVRMEDQGRVILGLTEPSEPKTVPPGIELQILFRECFRQGLLMAARDELGLDTRDALLGESLTTGKATMSAEFSIHWTPSGLTIEVTKKEENGTAKVLASKKYSTNEFSLVSILTMCELDSREMFADGLRQAGFTAKGKVKRSKATLPAEVKKHLDELTFTSQFAALREIHAAMRSDGESPELLGGLSRAYANLGVLTEVNWSPAHRAFKARALLYAERLAVSDPKSAWSLWHRGYATALAGDHNLAARYFAQAQKLEDRPSVPSWAEAADAYCRFRTARLAELTKGQEKGLAGLLLYLSQEHVVSNADLIKAGSTYLESNPECYRVLDSMSAYGGLGYSQVGSAKAAQIMNKTLYAKLRQMSQFPKTTAPLLDVAADGPAQGEPALLKAMREAPADGDASWGMLADLIQQTRYLHAWRRLEYLHHLLSVPVDQEFAADALPLVGNHPYRAFLENYGKNDPRATQNLRDFVNAVRISETEPITHVRFWALITRVDSARSSALLNRAIRHQDIAYRDQLGVVKHTTSPPLMNVQFLLGVAPYSPAAQAEVVKRGWSVAEKHAERWEKEGHPLVLSALGQHYIKTGPPEAAERCLDAAIRKGADRYAYLALADHYAAQKNEAKWLQTIEASLKLEDIGLATAKTRTKIAEHYMKAKEWQKALPHAENAAQTGASWAMKCAAQCNHALENWEKAESYISATSKRYELEAFEWYTWCRHTGKGDEEEARKLAEEYIRSWQGAPTNRNLGRSGMYYLLSNQHAKAEEVWRRSVQLSNDERVRMYLVLTADRAGNKKLRDDTLRTFQNQPTPLADVARQFQKVYSGDAPKLDLESIDKSVKAMSIGLKPEGTLFIGMFLMQQGKVKDAIPYLERPDNPQVDEASAIAAALLREAKKQ